MTERGQLYTLEGITAGLVVLLGLFFALQAVTATPGSGGALNPHVEQQDRAMVADALRGADDEQLRQAVLFWDDSDGFHCSPDGVEFYPGTTDLGECSGISPGDPNAERLPPNAFGNLLEQRFGDGYSYNVVVRYVDGSGDLARQRLVFQGQPGSSAVSASTTVTLRNDHQLYEDDDDVGDPQGTKLADDPSALYAPPARNGAANDDDLYNVVSVEVVVWR